MKNLILSLLAVHCLVFTAIAQIPNASFEKWTNKSGIEKPVGWITYDGIPADGTNLTPNTITPVSPGYKSDTALQMKVMTYDGDPWVSDLETGFYCNQRYQLLVGYLKTVNPQKDTLEISINFYNKKNPIGNGDFQPDTTNAANFYKFTIPIMYISEDVPDSASIYITYLTNNPVEGDAFILDSLTLPFNTSVQNISQATGLTIGSPNPNPASNYVNIPVYAPHSATMQISIYNILGQNIKTTENKEVLKGNSNLKIDLSDIRSGLYFISMQTDNTDKIIRKLIVK